MAGIEVTDQPRREAQGLVDLARVRFGELSEAELKLLRAAPMGEVAYCGPSDRDDDPANDPRHADEKWGPGREIRARLIRWLCTDRAAASRVDPKGIQVMGAKITGELDLSFAVVSCPLSLRKCGLTKDAKLSSTIIPAVILEGTWARSIVADSANVRGDVFLSRGFRAEGRVILAGAQIGGDLSCIEGTFINPPNKDRQESGIALDANAASIGTRVFFGSGFHAEGQVSLSGARIAGDLNCIGGTFHNPLIQGLKNSGTALNLGGARVSGSVTLSSDFRAEGMVDLRAAVIGGALVCSGARIVNPPLAGLTESGIALRGDGAKVGDAVFLNYGFHAEGATRLAGAQIAIDLDCSGGAFTDLVAHTAAIKGNFLWSKVRNPQREQHDVPSDWTGAVSAPNQDRTAFAGRLDLTNASTGAIVDDELSWPNPEQGGTLLLAGFVYQRISTGPRDAPERLEWLGRQQHFALQPYRQLAKVLREAGDDRGARHVLYEMERLRRVEEDHSSRSKAWGRLLQWTIGYGYYPQWAFWWLVGLVVLGAWLFWMGYNHRAIAPTEKVAYGSFHDHGVRPHDYEHFHPVVYSLENSFPLVKLGQADKWSPDPADTECPGCNGAHRLWYCVRSWSCELRWFRWVQICLGWVLATLFVAGVTGIVRRE